MRRLAFALILAAGCQKDPVKCEKGIRNYHQLVYWEQANAEIDAAPPAQRDALRKDKLAQFERDIERALPTVVSKCTSANSDDEVDCMIAAKTAAQAKACVN